MTKRVLETRRTRYTEDWQCYRHIVAAIMFRAYQDALGIIESSGGVLRCKEEIMKDGAAYFDDGRFEYHAELIGLDPSLRPDWRKS